ncbi:PAS domain S-box protein [Archangium lansingense]|uniref:histidine kinase n=1 Tax=Archangium lansingense TaxID=2995310 RepID=A0ABT4AK13_9BACT|nr:PAS domain S-box protein [Archangium lansinium]MCY1081204.1 PAS domain S-box protein [Archangium lansinium]
MNFDPHTSESSPITLADLLETRHEDIIHRWMEHLREGLAPGPRSQAELEDHIGEYLWEMTRVLRQHTTSGESSVPEWLPVAREHGGQRLRIGFDVQALVREYHVLRECILDLVKEARVRVTLGEVRALSAFITTSIAEGVAEYLRQRDAVQRLGEERLRALLDQAPAAIFAKDAEGRYLYSNRYQQQLVGRPLEEILGRDDSALFPKALADSLRANDAWVFAGHTCTFEEEVELASGPRTYLSVKFPLHGGEDRPSALGGISTDITARKQSERALREREERFRQLVEGVKDYAIFMLDTEGRIISWNAGAERIKGYTAQEVLGQHLSLFYTPEDVAAGLPGECIQTAATQGYCRTEGVRVRKGGQRFWAEAIITALRDEAGMLHGFSKVTRDISERKRNEQTLRETTQRLQAILDTAVDGIITIDEQGLIQSVNLATTHLFGYAPEELIGQNVSLLMPEPYRSEHDGYMKHYLLTGERKVIGIGREAEGRRKDGSIFPLELTVSETLLPQGRLFTGRVRDITARKRAEQTQAFFLEAGTLLSQSLDVTTTLKKLASLAVRHLCDYCTVDLLGEDGQLHRLEVASRNPAMEEPLYRTRPYPPMVGSNSPMARALANNEALAVPTVTAAWLDAAARNAEHRALLEALDPKSVALVPLVARGRKLGLINLIWTRPHANELAADLEVAKGLADRAAMAIDNARLYQEAQEAIRVREDVVAIVSHDLRNPLNAIALSATLLEREAVSERASRAAYRITAAAERASGMIRDLLDFTQARAGGGIPIHPQPLDFHEQVRRAVEEVRLAWPGRYIDLQASGDGQGEGDEGRLAQVVTNLVGNALQHSPPGTPVRVSTRSMDSSFLLEVHNEGPAISAELLPTLFEPYHRGPEAGAGRGSLGLGLYITQQIVLGHGGTLDVRSTPMDGTTFTVRLPRRPPPKGS